MVELITLIIQVINHVFILKINTSCIIKNLLYDYSFIIHYFCKRYFHLLLFTSVDDNHGHEEIKYQFKLIGDVTNKRNIIFLSHFYSTGIVKGVLSDPKLIQQNRTAHVDSRK